MLVTILLSKKYKSCPIYGLAMVKTGETFSTADSIHKNMSLLCLTDAFDSIDEWQETTSAVFTLIIIVTFYF